MPIQGIISQVLFQFDTVHYYAAKLGIEFTFCVSLKRRLQTGRK
jgi:hypothetical protein